MFIVVFDLEEPFDKTIFGAIDFSFILKNYFAKFKHSDFMKSNQMKFKEKILSII
jgi:hypothetical protein